MNLVDRAAASGIRTLARILLRIEDAPLSRVPAQGPLILVANHINFLDIPVLYTHLRPRPMTALAKAETWDNPILSYLFNMGGAIPLRRGEADSTALRRGLEALQAGQILGLAPEGTRSNDGRLQRGHPGIVLVALRSGAPLMPVVLYGHEQCRNNLRRLRRTDCHVVVGDPFHIDVDGAKVTHELRQRVTDEIMYQLAALLPPAYRGCYSDLTAATADSLRFPAGASSNLIRAGPA